MNRKAAPGFIPTTPQIGVGTNPAYRWNPEGVVTPAFPSVTQAFQNQTGALGVNKHPSVDQAVSAMRTRQTGH